MSYINFDKVSLINLEYSLSKELLRSNRAGCYSSTTIIGCNTRKYHGLLITRQPNLDDEHHVLLSTIDETIIQQKEAFDFGIHKYKGGNYAPKGHKYIRDFVTEPIPKILFRVGGVFLTKEMLFTHNEARVIIKYTLEDAHSPTILRLRPFLAFRNHHSLSKANHDADTRYEPIENGIRMRLYQGYSPLFIQVSKSCEYVHVPDWYRDIEYQEELARGYEHHEDLFTPGYLEFPIRKGESVFLSAGLEEVKSSSLNRLFNNEVRRRIPRDNFVHCLVNSAHQFIIQRGKKAELIAGMPWFGRHGRDSFIALPGLTLIDKRYENFHAVIRGMIADMDGCRFPEHGQGSSTHFDGADTGLWFFWALQQYVIQTRKKAETWKLYGRKMLEILRAYRDGFLPNIRMTEDGLITAGDPGIALTWMDAIVDGRPVTPRNGKAVEINALWYNALCFTLDLAKTVHDQAVVDEWKHLAGMIPSSFRQAFWDEKKAYLADVVSDNHKDWSVRPNMVIAVAMPYCPASEEMRKKTLDKAKTELLTPRGLRSLSPKDPSYRSIYQGNPSERDLAAHQGTVWPWLLSFFVDGYFAIHGRSALSIIRKLYTEFEPVVKEHGIGSISEVYDGDPPYHFGGAPSKAASVAALLSVYMSIQKMELKKD